MSQLGSITNMNVNNNSNIVNNINDNLMLNNINNSNINMDNNDVKSMIYLNNNIGINDLNIIQGINPNESKQVHSIVDINQKLNQNEIELKKPISRRNSDRLRENLLLVDNKLGKTKSHSNSHSNDSWNSTDQL